MSTIPIRYDSISSIAAEMERNGLVLLKKFGQNFLISAAARDKVFQAAAVHSGMKRIWEIGPGIGSITVLLAETAVPLTLFEIDHGFCRLLTRYFGSEPQIRIVPGDFLKNRAEAAAADGIPDLALGNLPYNAGSAMIASFVEHACLPARMVFTLQKEVAMRITARPGTAAYASFTLLCGLDYDTEVIGDLAPGNFYPRPEVTSTIVQFERRTVSRVTDSVREIYLHLIRDLFRSRRKTIRNSLLQGTVGSMIGKPGIDRVLEGAGIDPGVRGEALGPDTVAELAKLIRSYPAEMIPG